MMNSLTVGGIVAAVVVLVVTGGVLFYTLTASDMISKIEELEAEMGFECSTSLGSDNNCTE